MWLYLKKKLGPILGNEYGRVRCEFSEKIWQANLEVQVKHYRMSPSIILTMIKWRRYIYEFLSFLNNNLWQGFVDTWMCMKVDVCIIINVWNNSSEGGMFGKESSWMENNKRDSFLSVLPGCKRHPNLFSLTLLYYHMD